MGYIFNQRSLRTSPKTTFFIEKSCLAQRYVFTNTQILMKPLHWVIVSKYNTLANDTEYGLGASIFSKDTAKAEKISRHIEAGMVYINAIVVSDSRLPYGGVKNSGVGRECAEDGIKEFANIKPIWIN